MIIKKWLNVLVKSKKVKRMLSFVYNKLYLLLTFYFFQCASIPVFYPVYFEPAEKNINYIYQNGTPIVSYNVNGLFILFSIEEVRVLNKDYFRLWVLCNNKSEVNINLEPNKIFKLNVKSKSNSVFFMQNQKKYEGKFNAITPSILLNYIDNVAANEMIMKSVGAALKSMSTQNTQITSSSSSGKVNSIVNDSQEKRDAIGDRLASDLQNTTSWYSMFSNSLSQGLLRKNTLFPNQSVNGYIFFENRLNDILGGKMAYKSFSFDFELDVNVFDKVENIKLKAVKGE